MDQLERARSVLILEESSLELLPKKLQKSKGAKTVEQAFGIAPEMQIFDNNFHGNASAGLSDREKRGRPDVVHFALLDATSTPLFSHGKIEIVVHAIGGDALIFQKGTRPPRTLQRFCGVMAKILSHHEGEVELKLVKVVRGVSFQKLIDGLNVERVVSLTTLGEKGRLEDVIAESYSRTAFVVGGFAHGHFNEDVTLGSSEVVSIAKESLPAHVVTARVCYELEKSIGL